jgi:hypothetical protein
VHTNWGFFFRTTFEELLPLPKLLSVFHTTRPGSLRPQPNPYKNSRPLHLNLQAARKDSTISLGAKPKVSASSPGSPSSSNTAPLPSTRTLIHQRYMYLTPHANDLRHQPPLELQPFRIPRKPCSPYFSSNG